jgi:predicted  nucleic acid-binding Zn-ribbon protein
VSPFNILERGFYLQRSGVSTTRWLYELQEIDLELEQKSEALKQVEDQLGKDEALAQARTAFAEDKERVAELERRQRAAEWDVEDLGAKIIPLAEKLYGGSVRNPKELLNMEQELERLKAQRREREDQLLDIMEELELARQEFKTRSGEMQELEQEWRRDQERLMQEQEQLKSDLAALEQSRGPVLARIDSISLELYQALRHDKQGLAVATVKQGRCQGCRIILPMSKLQRPKVGQEPVLCSNCGRILYLE